MVIEGGWAILGVLVLSDVSSIIPQQHVTPNHTPGRPPTVHSGVPYKAAEACAVAWGPAEWDPQ